MKKFFLFLLICCSVVFWGCKKEKFSGDDLCEECEEGKIPLWDDADGSVWINDNPDIVIIHKDEYPEERETLIDPEVDPKEDLDDRSELWDDADESIWINDNPDVDIDIKDEYPEEQQTLF